MNIKCPCCGQNFDKPLNEYNRRIKLNSPMYCSRKCSAINNFLNFKDKVNRIPPVKKQKMNPFKYYLRNCKRRVKHELNIDLEYLEELWNIQKGICPYTKCKLILNNHSKRNKDPRYTASLDRIDNSKGYIKGNVQFVSVCINYLKCTITHDETIEFLKQISSTFAEDRTISSPSLVLDALGSS